MQIITITGNLVADAECRTGKESTEFISFRLAANEVRGEEKRTTFYDVSFMKNGLLQYLKKGVKVTVIGRLTLSACVKDDKAYVNASVFANYIELCTQARED